MSIDNGAGITNAHYGQLTKAYAKKKNSSVGIFDVCILSLNKPNDPHRLSLSSALCSIKQL